MANFDLNRMLPRRSPPDTVEFGHPQFRNNWKVRCRNVRKLAGPNRGMPLQISAAHGKPSPVADVADRDVETSPKACVTAFSKEILGLVAHGKRCAVFIFNRRL